MKIKRIDLVGFKSFCDRTSIDLSNPITAVVGPNGCGKSNIVDALLWAMGEQRARQLRGKTMEDVIFNGSDTRGPAGMAEISLTFENDGRAPIEYRDYSEITVTRRLHRDGTSEYAINKLPVRLRDVTNLFLGTGVGTRAYAIIEQGRVGMIVSAKPEDRRHFIDEAAGITKYRRRKQAAERKMEATRQNLLRVSDILEEIGKRLGTLRRQAQKAERYKRYKVEMRSIELRAASHRLLGSIAAEKVTEQRHAQISAERVLAEAALQAGELALETARIDVLEQERELNRQQEELYQLDNRIKLGESQCEFQSKEAKELVDRAERSRADVDGLAQQLAEAEQRHAEVAAQVATVAEHRAGLQADLAARERVHERLRRELAEMSAALEGERDEIARSSRDVARAEADLRALRQRRSDLEGRSARQRTEGGRVLERLEALGLAATDLDGELGRLRVDLDRLMQRREDALGRLTELRETSNRGEAELEVLRTELHRRRSRLTSLEEIQARYEGFGNGTRAIMRRHNGESKDQGILGLVADVLDAPAHYETALEAVLGQRLGTVVVESENIGVEAIGYLKEAQQGRGSFISRSGRPSSVLDKAPIGVVWDVSSGASVRPASGGGPSLARARQTAELIGRQGVHGPILGLVAYDGAYRQVAETLLGDVMVVEDLQQGLAVWADIEDHTLVTLDGEILGPDGTVTGGSHDAELSGVLRQKREIKELAEIIRDLEQQYEVALDRHVSVKTEIAALEQLLDQVTRDGHESDKEILTREKDLGRINSENEALARQRREMARDLDEFAQEIARLDGAEERLLEAIVVGEAAFHVGDDTVALLLRARGRLGTRVDDAAAATTDAKVALARAVAAHDASADSLRQLDELVQDRRERIDALEQASAEGRARAEDLRQQVETARGELEALVGDRAAAAERLDADRSGYEQTQTTLAEQEQALKQQRSEMAELGIELGQLELKRSELALARQHLEEQVWDRYRERLLDVLHDFHLEPPVSDEELTRLDQLRDLVARMGEINLTAIEEFRELDERHSFLSEHRADLESALGQLQRAIQKINRTSRKRFLETFERVNEKFQEVFPRLFRGGRGKLVLTDAEDVLEAGVDIVAQPPGKKLASMDVMSGGEKALTATSLIFAMFLVRPTPFCLLDEVDAPLDEANVVRFREMVREMANTSQFIIITHNRNTMEICDRLYGVTMEQPGCSTVVSVNLSDAEAVAA